MMDATARFHANETALSILKERQKLRTPQMLVANESFMGGDAVDLKNVLGKINADCGNLQGVVPLISRF